MTRRITISPDGTVKLRGVKTRWRVERGKLAWWYLIDPSGDRRAFRKAEMRWYLETLSEDLLGIPRRVISISRAGAVTLNGLGTRWTVRKFPDGWIAKNTITGAESPARKIAAMRRQLGRLTDEELLG